MRTTRPKHIFKAQAPEEDELQGDHTCSLEAQDEEASFMAQRFLLSIWRSSRRTKWGAFRHENQVSEARALSEIIDILTQ
ncbi:unnamed protein product, partial [Cylicocyclus nassatus]